MEELIKSKHKLEEQLLDYQKKVFDIENQIINIDKELATFSDTIILQNMKLSVQQSLIVNAEENKMLVVACPGSGKTHTLISRYIKLCVDEDMPDKTLLITFTKKAGMEMLNRLNKIVPTKIPYYVGSLHGLSYKVLQEYNNINYTILDDKESREYLKNLVFDENIKSKICMILDQTSTTYPFDLKTTLSRMGENTKVFMIGCTSQIDSKYVNKHNNALLDRHH